MKKKQYRIELVNRFALNKFLHELSAWGVATSLYQVDGLSVITKNNNVIDVATETFAKQFISIKEEKV